MDEDLAVAAESPRVTVLMPVYNGERFLPDAIDSILAQTFAEFELLVVDDGSTDRSAAIVSSYADSRIRLVQNGENLGLIATLNRGLELARGGYVARMDCDDVSLPERLARQVSFMDAHPEIGVCGAWYLEFGASIGSVMRLAPDHESIRCGTLFNPVVGHPTVFLRKSAFRDNGLCYDAAFAHAEDYQLWARAMKCCNFANIPELLLYYRVHAQQVTRSRADEQLRSAGEVRRALLRELGVQPDREEFEIHQMLSSLTRPVAFRYQDLPVGEQLEGIDRWLCKLKEANDRAGIYPEPQFSRMLVERWVGVCVLNYLSRGKWSPRLFAPPMLFRQTQNAWGSAASFFAARLSAAVADLRLRFSRHGEEAREIHRRAAAR